MYYVTIVIKLDSGNLQFKFGLKIKRNEII